MAHNELGVSCEVIDLRSILPWDYNTVCEVSFICLYSVLICSFTFLSYIVCEVSILIIFKNIIFFCHRTTVLFVKLFENIIYTCVNVFVVL